MAAKRTAVKSKPGGGSSRSRLRPGLSSPAGSAPASRKPALRRGRKRGFLPRQAGRAGRLFGQRARRLGRKAYGYGAGTAAKRRKRGFIPPAAEAALEQLAGGARQAGPEETAQEGAGEELNEGLSGEALQQALSDAYESGYHNGSYEGGEAIVARLIPPNTILPGYTAADLILAGIRQLPPGVLVPVMPAAEVAAALGAALDASRPLSVVRLGDGELLTLAHETVLPTEEAKRRGHFLPYAGVELPAPGVREALASALRKADIIGVPQSRHPSFQGLLYPVFSHYGLDPRGLRLTFSTVNFVLAEQGLLLPLLQGRRVLVCGNKAEGLARVLRENGIEVSGVVSPVNGVHDTEIAVLAASGYQFDLALVAAGIAAVMICAEIAARLGKPALDFGHVANKLESGEMTLR